MPGNDTTGQMTLSARRPHHVDLWKKFMSWKDLHEIMFTHVDEPEYFPEIQRAEQLARAAMKAGPTSRLILVFKIRTTKAIPWRISSPSLLCAVIAPPRWSPRNPEEQDPFELFSTDYYFSCPGCRMTYLVPEKMKLGYFFYEGRLI